MTKRTLTFLICAILSALMLALPASALLGDLNGDEQRTAIDYFALKRYMLGTHTLSESALSDADLNGDGTVSGKDYMILKRVILGTYTLAEHEEDIPEDTLSAIVRLSIILQNASGEEIAVLENTLTLNSSLFETVLEDFFAMHPEYAEGELATLDQNALQELSDLLSKAILDSLTQK